MASRTEATSSLPFESMSCIRNETPQFDEDVLSVSTCCRPKRSFLRDSASFMFEGSTSCLIWSQPTGISYQLMYWRVESFHMFLPHIFVYLFLKFGELYSFPMTDRAPTLEMEHSFKMKKEGHNDSKLVTHYYFSSHLESKVDFNRGELKGVLCLI